MIPRILIPEGWQQALPDGRVELGQAEHHHLAVVLRRREGDALELFDGTGRAIAAVLEAGESSGEAKGRGRGSARQRARALTLVARLTGPERAEPAPDLSIGLAQGISSNERMDWTIEKAVEAGVDHLVALQAARSASRGAPHQIDDRRAAHWERIIASACAQCGRNRLAQLDAVAPTLDWLARDGVGDRDPTIAGNRAAPAAANANTASNVVTPVTRRFLLAPGAQISLAEALREAPAPGRVWVACGPEAGFDEAESQSFVKAGWEPVGMGPRTLRTETAGLMAVAIIQSQWGDLR